MDACALVDVLQPKRSIYLDLDTSDVQRMSWHYWTESAREKQNALFELSIYWQKMSSRAHQAYPFTLKWTTYAYRVRIKAFTVTCSLVYIGRGEVAPLIPRHP